VYKLFGFIDSTLRQMRGRRGEFYDLKIRIAITAFLQMLNLFFSSGGIAEKMNFSRKYSFKMGAVGFMHYPFSAYYKIRLI